MNLEKELYRKLPYDKIRINWNKNPIRIDQFLSFLIIDTDVNNDHLGASTGWTQRINKDHNLIIGGGIVNGVNWLDTLQYGVKLGNHYNNYVNPFYLMDIMTNEGIHFFLEYYRDEIDGLIRKSDNDAKHYFQLSVTANKLAREMRQEIEFLNNPA